MRKTRRLFVEFLLSFLEAWEIVKEREREKKVEDLKGLGSWKWEIYRGLFQVWV